MLAAMRRAIACAALVAGCGDNAGAPDVPVTVIADAAPDAAVMPCTGGVELVGQFTETSAGDPPEFPVVQPTVGHPDGFDVRVATWHVTHLVGTELVPDSAVAVEFTGYDAAALNAGLASMLTQPDIDGGLLEFAPDVGGDVELELATAGNFVVMDVRCFGLLPVGDAGLPAIAPFGVSCGVTFLQIAPDRTITMAHGGGGAMQLVCD